MTRERPGAALLPDGLRWPLGAGETPLTALEGLLARLNPSRVDHEGEAAQNLRGR